MGFMKRSLDAARDQGTDAFYAGAERKSPWGEEDIKTEYWYEGFDYGQDMAVMGAATLNEEQIQQMNGYWEDFYAGEHVGV